MNYATHRQKTWLFSFFFLFPVEHAFAGGKKAIRIPSSFRAEQTIKDRTPQLKKHFKRLGLKWGAPVYIRIFKREKKLEIWSKKDNEYILVFEYPICEFSGHVGPKQKRGDRQAPEGLYTVKTRQLNPYSSYYLSFNIGYPNAYDRYHGRTGSHIMVHGSCVSIGCFAMTDTYIKDIYTILVTAFREGQKEVPLHVFPFKMNWLGRWRHQRYKWQSFWKELQPFYDYFEKHRQPPPVKIQNGEYKLWKK